MKRTYIPNEYNGEAWVLIDVLGVVTKGYGTCKLLHVEYCSWIYDIIWYILFFYFELADDIYSVPVFCTDPYLYVFFLFIVECSKRTVVFNSTATLASLHHVRFQGELKLLAWTRSSSSCLDALKFWHRLAIIYV